MDESQCLAYWEYRVMRHRYSPGNEEYAVHEVYFDVDGDIRTWTVHAISPREKTIDALRISLLGLLSTDNENFVCGDLKYEYDREELLEWLSSLDKPILDYSD